MWVEGGAVGGRGGEDRLVDDFILVVLTKFGLFDEGA
jgi:hypothetical protein